MVIDLSPVISGDMKMLEFSRPFSVADLRDTTNHSLDTIRQFIEGKSDTYVTFLPVDPNANDPFAKPGEENIGWSLAHLVAHVTASSEEWATYSSILARGIHYPAEPRLRFETEWTSITSTAQTLQRLEESRRLRLGYLAAWPDQPDLTMLRGLSPRYVEKFGEMNAPAAFLFGLMHEVGHHEQFREVARQADAALAGV
jgi:DinB superfamily